MLILKPARTEPFWLEILPGQRTQFRPITVAMLMVAREQAGKAVLAALPDAKAAKEAGPAADFTRDKSLAEAAGNVHIVVALAQLGIVAWEGVGDADGNPIAPTSASIADYLGNWRVYDAVRALYVEPEFASLDEKNASAPSRPGTSGAKIRAKATAKTARKRANPAPTS